MTRKGPRTYGTRPRSSAELDATEWRAYGFGVETRRFPLIFSSSQLLATEDWDAAGHAYAAEHDRHSGVVHVANQWFTEFYLETGPQADARRARALPLIAHDPSRQPDTLFSGPDVPVNEAIKKRFFAED
jgi:hypothetical protein